MLTLDSPRWAEISDAYGRASKIPKLIQALEEGRAWQNDDFPEQEPWFSLWSGLCHQGDVYTASYAAVPHLIRIARQQCHPVDWQFLALPAAIEIARLTGYGPAVPDDLYDAYLAAFAAAHALAFNLAGERWDDVLTRSILALLAVSKGQVGLAEMLLKIDDPAEALVWWSNR